MRGVVWDKVGVKHKEAIYIGSIMYFAYTYTWYYACGRGILLGVFLLVYIR